MEQTPQKYGRASIEPRNPRLVVVQGVGTFTANAGNLEASSHAAQDLAACWNACEGIGDPKEAIPLLMKACQRVVDGVSRPDSDAEVEAWVAAREALAAAKP